MLQFTEEWRDYVTRQVLRDFDNDYKTPTLTTWKVSCGRSNPVGQGPDLRGVPGSRVLLAMRDLLSNTETRMDDVYRDRQDPAVTVWFELETGERILRTTTPWTLHQTCLAVGPDIDYAVLEADGERWIIAESRLGAHEAQLGEGVQVGSLRVDLVGRRYRSVRLLAEMPNAFQVLSADFVSTEDGTRNSHGSWFWKRTKTRV